MILVVVIIPRSHFILSFPQYLLSWDMQREFMLQHLELKSCVFCAEIGENTSLYLYGFNPLGIAIVYILGYALAGFTTFATILGRYNHGSPKQSMCSCCSVLEQDSQKGFISNL